ncbi:MAG: zinc finger domain-containing protein [Candidatus Thermoplasmatota archaeon]
MKLVEKCPKCGNTVMKDSKEEAYWCAHCKKYYSYEKVKKSE